jgi:hypothetical protein
MARPGGQPEGRCLFRRLHGLGAHGIRIYEENRQRWLELHLEVDDSLLPYLSPLGWEHINLTDHCIWRQSRKLAQGKFRPLRSLTDP